MSVRNKSHVFYTWIHQCLNICLLVFKFYLLIYFYWKHFACMYDFLPGIYIYIYHVIYNVKKHAYSFWGLISWPLELQLQMWAPMWVLGTYPVLWNYNLLTTEPSLEPSIYSFNALKFAWLWIFCSRHLPLHVPSPHFHVLQTYYVTVWWCHLTFLRHFLGNSVVLVLVDFSMNFRMHISNFKNNSLVVFLWALLSTYSVSIYTVHYNRLIFFLSGNVFLCDVRDWTQCHTVARQVFSWTMSSWNLLCSQKHVHVSSDRPCMFLTWLPS